MKLLKQILPEYNARIRESDNGFTIIGASGQHIGVFPPPPDPYDTMEVKDMPMPLWSAYHAVAEYIKLDNATALVGGDARLTKVGRDDRLQESRKAALVTLSAVARSLREYKARTEAQEIARYAVPPLRPDDVRGELRDAEIRNGIRILPDNKRTKLLQALADGIDDGLMLAILRSPLQIMELEAVARSSWVALIDRRDPAGLEALKMTKAAITWAEAIVSTIAAVLMPMVEYSREEIYTLTKIQEGAKLFKLTDSEVAIFERRMQSAA